MNIPRYEKAYSFHLDFTSFDVLNKIADFRRESKELGRLKVIIPVEKEWRLRGLKYDLYETGTEIGIGLQEPNCVIIQTIE